MLVIDFKFFDVFERRQAANGSQPAGSPLGLAACLGTPPGFGHSISPAGFPRLNNFLKSISKIFAGGRSVILAKAKPSGCWCEQAPSEDEETSQHHFTSAG